MYLYMSGPESSLEIIAIILAIRFVASEAAFERASRSGEATIFRPVLGLRLLFGVAIPGFLFGASQLLRSGQRSDAIYAVVVFIGGAIGLFFAWPGTIRVDSTSIRETRWFGLRRRQIVWSDVAYAGGDVDNSVTIRSKDDRVIQHTQYHVDRAGFTAALKEYCANCSYNFPSPKPWVPLSSS